LYIIPFKKVPVVKITAFPSNFLPLSKKTASALPLFISISSTSASMTSISVPFIIF